MRPLGILLCVLLLAAPLIHYWPLMVSKNTAGVVSQYVGFVSFIAMALIMILATRWRFIEPIFGGMDRVYLMHKWLGILAVATAVWHETIEPEVNGREYGTRFDDLAEDIGEFAYDGMLIFVAITLLTFIPYNWWRQTHKLMGAIFCLAAFHSYFIEKSFSNSSALGIYILALSVIGMIAYAYTLLPASWVRSMQPYSVSRVEDAGNSVSITLSPKGKPIRHQAGQFAFVGFSQSRHKEVHPFTISSAPDPSGDIRFSIKALGDGTSRLADSVKVGQSARVSQGFGHFLFRKPQHTHIWVAGGIGITPFLAWARALPTSHGPVHLFACCKSREDVAHLDELQALAAQDANFHLSIQASSEDNRLSLEILKAVVTNPKTTIVSFCGPEPMRAQLAQQVKQLGIKRRNFQYEEFQIRTGLPVGGLLFPLVKLWNSALVQRFSTALTRRLNGFRGAAGPVGSS